MAAVRIEEEAFGDGRYEHLGQLLGTSKYDALGRMTFLWRQCTQEQSHVLPESFVRVFVNPDFLVEARLGERVDAGIRIRGTRGRIEWLARLRKNGKKGGRPRKPDGSHLVCDTETRTEPEPNPLALSPSLSPASSNSEKNSAAPSAGGSQLEVFKAKVDTATGEIGARRARKAKPSEPTDDERASVRVVLDKLTAQNGVRYSGTDQHSKLIVAQLRRGVSEMDLRAIIGYCALELGWKDKPDMVKYLRPETLFGPQTIARYLDPARSWFATLDDNTSDQGSPSESRIRNALTFDGDEWIEPSWMVSVGAA